jgi:cystathionine gamma-synthase
MISIRLRDGYESAIKVQEKVKIFKRATSLGLTVSLIEHRASYEGPGSKLPGDMLRLSIGIEDVGDLIGDLEQALDYGNK